MCLGKSTAYLETDLVIAKILWNFDFAQAPGEAGKLGGGRPTCMDRARKREDELQLYCGIISDHDEPNLVFTRRKLNNTSYTTIDVSSLCMMKRVIL